MPNNVEEVEADDSEEVLERAGAIDVAKASGKVCVRIPGKSRRITRFGTCGRRQARSWPSPTSWLTLGSSGSSSKPRLTTGGPSSICWKPAGLSSGS